MAEDQEPRADLTGLRGEGLRCWTACDPMHTPVEYDRNQEISHRSLLRLIACDSRGDFKYEPKHNKIALMHRKRRNQEQKQATTDAAKQRMKANKVAQKREQQLRNEGKSASK